MSYMGLDIGTSGCKAVVFNEDGEQLALAYREYRIINPKTGWAELDSNQVCRNCFEVIKMKHICNNKQKRNHKN